LYKVLENEENIIQEGKKKEVERLKGDCNQVILLKIANIFQRKIREN
jgi:hypothetical protein